MVNESFIIFNHYSSTIYLWDSTNYPSLFNIFFTVQSLEALITCSIFIAYNAKIASPFFSLTPSFTNILEIVPGIGVMAFPFYPSLCLGYFLWSDSNLYPIASPFTSKRWTLPLSSTKNYIFLTCPLMVTFNWFLLGWSYSKEYVSLPICATPLWFWLNLIPIFV